VRDIAFWGTAAGAPTTTGLVITSTGGSLARPIVENVAAFNIQMAISVTGASASLRNLYLVGNSGAIYIASGYGAVIESPRLTNNVYGIYLGSGALNTSVIGGYFAANTTGLMSVGARSTHVLNSTFNGNTAAASLEKSGGGGGGTGGGENTFDGCVYLTNDPVSIYSNGNKLVVNGEYGSPAITLQSGATYNHVEYLGGLGGSYTDSSGQQNFKTYQSANGLEFYDSAMVSFEDGIVTSTALAATSATIGGAGISSGDFATAATGDYVKTDHVEELTAAAGVKIDSSGGASTTTTIKDGYINAIGILSVDGTCSWAVTNDTTDEITLQATTFVNNVTTMDVNGNLTPDKVTIQGAGGNVARIIHSEWVNATTVGTGSAETLDSVTIAAGTLAATGDSLEIEARYQATAANLCVFAIGFNGVGSNPERNATLSTTGSLIARSTVTRTGSATGRITFSTIYGTTSFVHDEMDMNVTWGSSSTLEVRLRTVTAPGDCYLKSTRVTYVPAVTP
jgi:hypothetical protein